MHTHEKKNKTKTRSRAYTHTEEAEGKKKKKQKTESICSVSVCATLYGKGIGIQSRKTEKTHMNIIGAHTVTKAACEYVCMNSQRSTLNKRIKL